MYKSILNYTCTLNKTNELVPRPLGHITTNFNSLSVEGSINVNLENSLVILMYQEALSNAAFGLMQNL